MSTTSGDFLQSFLKLHPKSIDLSLTRMHRLLNVIGNPERRLPPVVHVAGTNGKGSTIAFMRAILEASGQAVHVYTSPHLVRFHERIRLGRRGGGILVSEELLVDAFDRCERANAGEPVTMFELTTAAALLLFSEHPADILLLEVGLGGRLDATNVVDQPLAAVITPVSFDHVEYLGSTIERIAAEKAGILKAGRPAILSTQSDSARLVLEKAAVEAGVSSLVVEGRDYRMREAGSALLYEDGSGSLTLPFPRLLGKHQIINAATAIVTLRTTLEMQVSAEAVCAGLSSAQWPARLQLLKGRVADLAPSAEIWLDGGHNDDGGRVVADEMAAMTAAAPRPLGLVVGMLSSKDLSAFLRHFRPLASRLIAVDINQQDTARAPPDIAGEASTLGFQAETATDVGDAIRRLCGPCSEARPPRILLAGSLYLAGEVLKLDGTMPM